MRKPTPVTTQQHDQRELIEREGEVGVEGAGGDPGAECCSM